MGNTFEVVELEAVNTIPLRRKSFKETKGIKVSLSPGLVAGLAQLVSSMSSSVTSTTHTFFIKLSRSLGSHFGFASKQLHCNHNLE